MKSMEHIRPLPRPGDPRPFIGHVLPGCIYMIYGCLWTYNSLFRYHVARRQAILEGNDGKKLRYKNMLFSKYHSGWFQATPVEAIVFVVAASVACIGEVALYHEDQPVMEAVFHELIYFFTGLLGATEILRHYKFALPPSSEYAMYLIGLIVSMFLLTNHLHSSAIVDGQMHFLLASVNVISILCTALELMHRRNVTVALGRTLILFVQGVWTVAIAVIIYPLSFMHVYDLNDHTTMGYVTAFGVVLVAVALMVAFAMNVFITMRVRNMNLATVNRIVALTHHQSGVSGAKGEAGRPLISDSDYDM